jgi:predicted nucleotidyltransferase
MSERLDFLYANRGTIKAIAMRHKALSIAVFGSVARGEDSPESDFDFLVTFNGGASLTDLAGLHDELEKFLNAPVDVVSTGGLKGRHHQILEEALIL